MKRIVSLLLALIMVFALVACGGKTETKTDDTGKKDTSSDVTTNVDAAKVELDNTVKTGKTHLNIALSSAPATADPHGNSQDNSQQLYNWLYDGLVFGDGEANIVPRIATDWTMSEDGKTYTFNLRNDVKFHDGSDMTVEDVLFSIEHAMSMSYLKNYTSSIESAEQTGDWQIAIHLKESDNSFLYNLYVVKIISKAIVEKEGDTFGSQVTLAGTGPYMLESYDPNTLIKLKKNPYYFGECGNIETVNVNIITNNSTRVTALQTGELDFIQVPSSDWTTIVESGKFNTELQESSTLSTIIITMYDKNYPQYDIRVREAMKYAIDRKALIAAGAAGMGSPAYVNCNPKYVIGSDDSAFLGTYEYDVEKAKSLLKDAGYENGCDVGIFLVPKKNDNVTVAEIIQQMWEQVGIHCTIEQQDSTTAGTMSKGTDNGDGTWSAYQGVYITNSNYVHHMATMRRAITSNNIKTAVAKYIGHYDEIDTYFEKAQAATSDAERDEYYEKCNEFLVNMCVNCPLYYLNRGYAWAQGLNVDLSNPYYLFIQDWSWS